MNEQQEAKATLGQGKAQNDCRSQSQNLTLRELRAFLVTFIALDKSNSRRKRSGREIGLALIPPCGDDEWPLVRMHSRREIAFVQFVYAPLSL